MGHKNESHIQKLSSSLVSLLDWENENIDVAQSVIFMLNVAYGVPQTYSKKSKTR